MKRAFFWLFIGSVAIFLSAPFFGAQFIAPNELVDLGEAGEKIFWQLRVPRVCMAWIAGATLAICGMIFQALFRNPLAEPSILGVSSGASLGAALSMRFGALVGFAGATSVQLGAFAGALLAVGVVCAFARTVRGQQDATLLLAGIAVSALFGSMIMILQYMGGYVEAFRIMSWTMGGIRVVGFAEVMRTLPAVIFVWILARIFSRELDLILCGDEIATSRGVSLGVLRRILFVGVSLAVAIVVAQCGPISFLGLIAPHVARRIFGARHAGLAAASALVGGSLLVVCDAAARTLWAPVEVPVGILVSFLGAPFFLWLLLKRERTRAQ